MEDLTKDDIFLKCAIQSQPDKNTPKLSTKLKMVEILGYDLQVPEDTKIITVDYDGSISLWSSSSYDVEILETLFFSNDKHWYFDHNNEYGIKCEGKSYDHVRFLFNKNNVNYRKLKFLLK